MEDKNPTAPQDNQVPSVQQSKETQSPPEDKQKIPKKKIFLVISIILLALVFLLLILYFLVLNKNPQSVTQNPSTPQPTQQDIDDNIPEVNSVYYGMYNNSAVIFYTTENTVRIDKNPNFGAIIYSTGSAKIRNFKDISDPIKILPFQDSVDIYLFGLNEKKNKIYINIVKDGNREGTYPNLDDMLYVVDLNTLDRNIIWENQIGSNLYGKAKGITYVRNVINDQFVILDILRCYGCDPVFAGNIILNIDTGEEKYIESAGNIKINSEDGLFSYQKLENVAEQCPEYQIPNCNEEDNTVKVNRPRGTVYTEKLP